MASSNEPNEADFTEARSVAEVVETSRWTHSGRAFYTRGDDQIALDRRTLNSHTSPSRMLGPEMDSWGRAAPARVKEDETYRGFLHPIYT